jgi:Icc-related predicted phosphoesterase
MRRFLICSGVHSRLNSLEWLRRAAEARHPEGILFAGGVLDKTRQFVPTPVTEWGLTPEDAQFIELFFETLGKLNVFSAIIPGRVDTPLVDFLRMGMHAEVEFPGVHLVHATLIERGDIAVAGMGGHMCEGPVADLVAYPRAMVEYHLRPLWTAKQPHRILMLASPPMGALGGKAGTKLVGDLIDSYHPSLCVVNGPNENYGIQRVARTLIINPGHMSEGRAAWLDWHRPAEDQVEFLNLRHPEALADVGVRN